MSTGPTLLTLYVQRELKIILDVSSGPNSWFSLPGNWFLKPRKCIILKQLFLLIVSFLAQSTSRIPPTTPEQPLNSSTISSITLKSNTCCHKSLNWEAKIFVLWFSRIFFLTLDKPKLSLVLSASLCILWGCGENSTKLFQSMKMN